MRGATVQIDVLPAQAQQLAFSLADAEIATTPLKRYLDAPNVGRPCYQVYKGRDEVCPNCPVEATFADGRNHPSEQLLITPEMEAEIAAAGQGA